MALSRADTSPKTIDATKLLLLNKWQVNHTNCLRVLLAWPVVPARVQIQAGVWGDVKQIQACML